MKIFRSSGFDTIIGKGTAIQGDLLRLPAGSTTLIEGDVYIKTVQQDGSAKLHVNGLLEVDEVNVDELVINGALKAKNITVKTLAVNKTSSVNAETVTYEKPIFQAGAVINVTGGFKHASSTTAEQP